MTSPAQQAYALIQDQAVITTGWQLFVGRMPAVPDSAVCLYDTGGTNPNPRWLLDYKHIQALIRGPKDGYADGYAMASKIKDALLGIESQDVGSDRWVSVTGMGDIAFLKNDDNSRPLFTINFRVIIEPASNPVTHRDEL